jgi:two-component system response regulator DegU
MINLLIVDDHPRIRQCLSDIVGKSEKIIKIGECSDGKGVLPFLETNKVNVILMDYNMPLQNGVETTILVKQLYPDIKIIGLSTDDNIFIKNLFLKNGADLFMSKLDLDIKELISNIVN